LDNRRERTEGEVPAEGAFEVTVQSSSFLAVVSFG
jgi:hypothetical protein